VGFGCSHERLVVGHGLCAPTQVVLWSTSVATIVLMTVSILVAGAGISEGIWVEEDDKSCVEK
jgi:ABC-type proline/glycine betaine transport system permease subunit